jgi:hypothetical protein
VGALDFKRPARLIGKQQSGRRGPAGSVVQNATLYPAYAKAAVAEQKQQREN